MVWSALAFPVSMKKTFKSRLLNAKLFGTKRDWDAAVFRFTVARPVAPQYDKTRFPLLTWSRISVSYIAFRLFPQRFVRWRSVGLSGWHSICGAESFFVLRAVPRSA